MDLKKFKQESIKKGMPEYGVYLLRKFQAMYDELYSSMQLRTRHFVKFKGKHTTAGGDVLEEILVPGVKAYMTCKVSVHTLGTAKAYPIAHKCEDGKITIEMSADPGTDHVLEYTVNN